MDVLLSDVPISNTRLEVSVPMGPVGQNVVLAPGRLLVWVSLIPQMKSADSIAAMRVAPKFPTIIDTGCNRPFVLTERHLRNWAGIDPALLQGRLRSDGHDVDTIRGKSCPILAATLGIWRIKMGLTSTLVDGAPLRVELSPGLTLTPGDDFPELPLIGLPCLTANKLHLSVRGAKNCFTIYQE